MRLGTFNVWGLPEAFSDDVSSRMRVIAERLSASDLDILLIQEAWTREVRQTIRRGARRAGFAVSEGDGASGGLMTLSRLPIRSSRFDRFRFRGDPERFDKGEYLGGKGFETVEIEGPDGPFLLVNTHLHARYRVEDSALDSAVRMAQLLQIIAFVDAAPGTLVVGGDFNCREGEPEYEVFRGLTGAVELGDDLTQGTLSSSNFYKRDRNGPDKRIDFLFVRAASGVEWTAREARLVFHETARIRRRDRSLSDHFGFRVELDWRAGPAASQVASQPGAIYPRANTTARSLIHVGLAEADRREQLHFRWAGGFLLAAVAAAGLRRLPAVDRRSFLRGAVEGTALLALAPALGFGTLARFDSDEKRDVFIDARSFLAELEARLAGTRTT
ncbi:endonuclease/exonuclease/phosphatase family protein [Myxococcota bacterium]|nr:endonuclease/exonuclease/phosphatase family protein [Myxococcota bacterium]